MIVGPQVMPPVSASGKWKWVSANGLIHIHCDDIIMLSTLIFTAKHHEKES
jgi:hypothetical protein